MKNEYLILRNGSLFNMARNKHYPQINSLMGAKIECLKFYFDDYQLYQIKHKDLLNYSFKIMKNI